ncbi:HAD hydrolase-like protein [uncultured Desulfobacter sp.]|uniref:HAD hydrolase-like protein n=1 Tax=uncultured Desulfobacter sp. TaxID=240139 RepID=UPI0029F4F5E5|nr:HAD hydrolase-like protein [uncultured Desulfobacter sp.]
MKKNILFDLDGTLTDPFEGITTCIIYALEKLKAKTPEAKSLGWCIGPPLLDSFCKLLDGDMDQAQKAVMIYRERFQKIGMFENQVYETIPEALNGLKEDGYTLFVATSKVRLFAEKIIDHFDLAPFFKSVHGAEMDGTRADKTALIAYILEQEGLDPVDTVMVGDTAYDMVGAKENGIYGLGVLWGYGSRQDLEDSGAGRCISSPLELNYIRHI